MEIKLSKRLPDILLESLFVVAALLGALALDEWREDKEKQELAKRAQIAILQEMKDNKNQLDKQRPKHEAMLKDLSEKLAAYEKQEEKNADFDFNYSMVLLTSAAWDTARMTQSAQFMPFEDVRDYSKIYSFQELFVENQQKLIEMIMQIGDLEDEEFGRFTKGFIHRLTLLIEVNESLSGIYEKNKLESGGKK